MRRPIADRPGYAVDDDGTVWSLKGPTPLALRPQKSGGNRHEYRSVTLWIDGVGHQHQIHRLVLMTFVGPCPPGMHTRHLDGDSTNNALSNLAWGTPHENWLDKVRHGTHVFGSRCGTAKLTEEIVREIRRAASAGELQSVLAQRYGVNQPTISRVVNGVLWSHV